MTNDLATVYVYRTNSREPLKYRGGIADHCGKNLIRFDEQSLLEICHYSEERPARGLPHNAGEGQPVYLYPSSALINKSLEWVLYHEMVLTTKENMRNIITIEPKWLVEVTSAFYMNHDTTTLIEAQRKMEPLYDRQPLVINTLASEKYK